MPGYFAVAAETAFWSDWGLGVAVVDGLGGSGVETEGVGWATGGMAAARIGVALGVILVLRTVGRP